jgi:hypothetical protein
MEDWLLIRRVVGWTHTHCQCVAGITLHSCITLYNCLAAWLAAGVVVALAVRVWPPGPATHRHSPPQCLALTSQLTSLRAAMASHHQLAQAAAEEHRAGNQQQGVQMAECQQGTQELGRLGDAPGACAWRQMTHCVVFVYV